MAAIMTSFTPVEPKEVKGFLIEGIKTVLVYEDGEGIRRKGYYVIARPSDKSKQFTKQELGVTELIIDLKDKKNSKVKKEEAELMFETKSDNLTKFLIKNLSLIKK